MRRKKSGLPGRRPLFADAMQLPTGLLPGLFKGLLLLALVLGGLSCSDETPESISTQFGLSYSDAYFNRPVPGSSVTAAYLTLRNESDKAQTLVAFSSGFVDNVELHNHIHSDGQMQMRRVEQLTLESGETVELAPGGYHLMLFGAAENLQSLESIDLTLTSSDGQSLRVEALAKDLVAR